MSDKYYRALIIAAEETGIRCESTFKPSEQETIRCEQRKGHPGEHSAGWEWDEEESDYAKETKAKES